MKIKKSISLILIAAVIIGGFAIAFFTSPSAYKDERVFLPKKYTLPEKMVTVKSGTIVQNEVFDLNWDLDKTCVLLVNKSTNETWSTIPYDFYSKNEQASKYTADGICSTIRVTYVDKETHNEVEINSNSDATYVLADKLKSGIRVTYYFEKAQISVPVLFILEEDGMAVSVDIRGITEGENKIFKVNLLPFLASAKNGDNTYLFVPSGSGALMYTDDTYRSPRLYSERVYGDDLIEQPTYKLSQTQSVRMPVFGVKNEKNGILGIITSGDNIAEISATAGDKQYGYSGVGATFYLRGKTTSSLKGQSNKNSNLIKYTDGLVSLQRATVKYIPLSKDKSDYNGMAETYRNYLVKNKGLKTDVNQTDAVLTFYGGAMKQELFLGVPYKSFEEMTTIKQTQNIISDIKNKTDASLAVNLKGYGYSGIDNMEIGGGFTVESAVGGKSSLAQFMNNCQKDGIDAFFDFDMLTYSQNSNGYSTRQAAVNPNNVRTKIYPYTIVIREQNTEEYKYLNSRYNLVTSIEDILNATDELQLYGVGLSSLTSDSYSDYSSPDYYCKGNMSVDAERIIGAVKDKKRKVLGSSSNVYAAVKLDYIFDTPTTSSRYDTLDFDVPFYQMVLRGATRFTGGVINLSSSPKQEFLNSISLGCSLAFTLCDSADMSLVRGGHSAVSLSVYDGLSEELHGYIKSAKPLLEKLGSAKIVSYERNRDLSTTVFDNGTTVCVNYGNTPIETAYGIVDEFSFIYS